MVKKKQAGKRTIRLPASRASRNAPKKTPASAHRSHTARLKLSSKLSPLSSPSLPPSKLSPSSIRHFSPSSSNKAFLQPPSKSSSSPSSLPSSMEGKKPRILVLCGFGLNSEAELAYAFSLAGALPKVVHFSDISNRKVRLEDFEAFAIPGGWSFADEISSGKILANKLGSAFRSQFESFATSGKPVIGICNGFQTLVKLGALPNLSLSFRQEYTLQRNANSRFEDRWVWLKPQKSACKYLDGIDFLHCPVRHGEGRFVAGNDSEIAALEKKGLVVLKYADEKMDTRAPYPWNPNGSPSNIAGVCDTTGKIFALMPHPECSVRRITYPRFSEGISYEKNSIRLFQNIVKAAAEHI